MKKTIALLFTIALLISASVSGSDAVGEKPRKSITLGLSMCMLDENHARAVAYIEKYCAEYEGVDVKIITTNAEGSVEKEIGNIESLIMQDPDIILVYPVDSVGSVPGVRSIAEAGIPCIDTGFCVVGQVATTKARQWNELTMGKMQGDLVNKYLSDNPDKNLMAVYL